MGVAFPKPPALPSGLQQVVCLVQHAKNWDGRPAECRTGIFAFFNPFALNPFAALMRNN